MKKEGRGAVKQVFREDNKVCIVQWFDNKEVLSVSNESGAFPCDTCRRWSKEDQAFINVPRPVLIKQYNDKMGGVDLSDRMIAYYRIAARTRKWTIRLLEGDSVSSEESDFEGNQPRPSKRDSLPSEGLRKHKAAHLPRMMDLKNAPRCHNP